MFAGIAMLCGIGLMQIYSTTGGATRFYFTQIFGILIGLAALVVCLSIDYRKLVDKSHLLYAGVLVLLLCVLFLGDVRGGARRWIDLFRNQAAVGKQDQIGRNPTDNL